MSSPLWIERASRSLLGLLAASALAVGAVACTASGAMPDGAAPSPAPSAVAATPATGRPAPAPRPETVDDSSPTAVVASFAAAEAAEAYDLSLPLLAAADRDAAGSLDAWIDRHAALWPLTGAEVTGVDDDGTSATVTARLTYHSQLDETIGLVPARADGRWKVAREGDRWRISLADLEVSPDFPNDGGAVEATKAWSASRQACATPVHEYAGGLVAFPTVADALCGTSGDVVTGPAARLTEGPDGDAFIAAFGPQVISWARVVEVRAPVAFRAVLAPVDDRWIVAGLLPPR